MEGQLILDRFELREPLGSGGFGVVYRGFDRRLERSVAIKIIDGGASTRPRVLREAQAAARLNHPGIVALYELGDDGTRAYLVSELVEGETLAGLRARGELSDRDVAAIGAELCAALVHAHERGVIHRDVKPQNILVCSDPPQAKLMDFGVARVIDGQALTLTGDVLGTVAYMAPEQADGEQVQSAADLYSLALTLYECWTGRNPVAGRSPAATIRNLGRELPSLGKARPDLPADMSEVIDACLGADPDSRPEAHQLEGALTAALPFLSDEGALRPVPLAERLTRVLGPTRSPLVVAGAKAAGVALLGAGGLSLAGGAPPQAAYALPLLAGLLYLRLPRLAWCLASAGLVAWAALGAGRPGAAAVIALLAACAPLTLPSAGSLWPLGALSPLLGAVGLAPAYVAVAGLASSAPRRAGLALTGYVWLVAVEAVWGRRLLFGEGAAPPKGWPASAAEAAETLLSALSGPLLLGAIAWVAGALVLPVLVRGRALVLDLLGAVVWSATLLTGHRLIVGSHELTAGPTSPAALLAAALVAAVLATIWRSLRPRSTDLDAATLG